MKQVAQNYKTGDLILADVPAPRCADGGVLVRTHHSLVSAGTELMKVAESKMSMVGMARARPDQVKRVVDSLAQQGPGATYRKVMNRLDSFTPLGYSLAGTVVETTVDALPVGTRVASAGNEFAFHAEYNSVPENMCVPIPHGVGTVEASFATVGAIALHGLRRSEIALGESALVFGLGLIGQVLVRLLTAAGAHVVGIDLDAERCRISREGGAREAGSPDEARRGAFRQAIDAMTEGRGVDHVFLCAATDSNEPVELGTELARDRGRITDIGKVRLDLSWKDFYEKELDVVFSRSYGPGRYDPRYEVDGVDYPIAFVRWTMQRNMRAFLELIEAGRIDLADLITVVVPFEHAVETYEQLNKGTLSALGVVFDYGETSPLHRTVANDKATRRVSGFHRPRIGVIGAGSYATTMLLPHLKAREDIELGVVATSTSLSAKTAAERFDIASMTTDYSSILADPSVDAVVIATRHDSHARIVIEALEHGKAVFVEKPLAIDRPQLEEVRRAIERTGNDRLMVGFNRRFAPLFGWLRDQWEADGPQMVSYTVNAGPLPIDSWYAETNRHGTRFVGEGGHFIDAMSWWIGCQPVEVTAHALVGRPDDLEIALRFEDGSLGRISYLTHGSPRYPKETLLASAGGRTARLDNFRTAAVWGDKLRQQRERARRIDKGQAGQVAAFVEALRTGDSFPGGASSFLRTTEATIAARESALEGRRVTLTESRNDA